MKINTFFLKFSLIFELNLLEILNVGLSPLIMEEADGSGITEISHMKIKRLWRVEHSAEVVTAIHCVPTS